MEITKVGIIGVGTMGGALTLLLADNGLDVSIYDTWDANVEKTVKNAQAAGLGSRVHPCADYDALCQSLGSPKVFMFSLPNGKPGDSVVKTLEKYVTDGDIVIDASNENYKVTQARRETLLPYGVAYIGLGVSGGSYGARNGPSLMPGGDKWAVEAIMPILTKIAARDDHGRPCVTNVGEGGSGHFVKMIHNGIEHGIMSALCEAWELMDQGLNMTGDEIGAVFDSWDAQGELKGNFLVSISGPICRTKSPHGGGKSLLHDIRDAVVQDANDSEGTGAWANVQAIESHVPAPSLTAAHYMRIASSEIEQRAAVGDAIGSVSPQSLDISDSERGEYLERLRQAVYVTTLLCFVQGLDVLKRESRNQGWGVNIPRVLEIWRAGCIIKSDRLSDLLEASYAEGLDVHPLCRPLIAGEVKKYWAPLKAIVLDGVRADFHFPCLGATLEYLKYIGNSQLPTNFTEAQLDSFGAHGHDLRSEPVRPLMKGLYHNEWSG